MRKNFRIRFDDVQINFGYQFSNNQHFKCEQVLGVQRIDNVSVALINKSDKKPTTYRHRLILYGEKGDYLFADYIQVNLVQTRAYFAWVYTISLRLILIINNEFYGPPDDTTLVIYFVVNKCERMCRDETMIQIKKRENVGSNSMITWIYTG